MSSVTINDVAALAGVSIKTVSRVLNREAHVRPAMRERVLGAVKALNYTPNFAARALAGSRAYLLGLYYDNPSPGYISGVQLGAMNACKEAGYHLLVEQIEGEGPGSGDQLEVLLSTVKMDGLILSPPVCDRSVGERHCSSFLWRVAELQVVDRQHRSRRSFAVPRRMAELSSGA